MQIREGQNKQARESQADHLVDHKQGILAGGYSLPADHRDSRSPGESIGMGMGMGMGMSMSMSMSMSMRSPPLAGRP